VQPGGLVHDLEEGDDLVFECSSLVPSTGVSVTREFWSNEQTVSTAGKHGIRRNNKEIVAIPVLFTTDEMAHLLRTSRTAIYAMVAREQLPGVVRIGRRVLFRREDVMRWLAQL